MENTNQAKTSQTSLTVAKVIGYAVGTVIGYYAGKWVASKIFS